jgi:hypothetical protein
MQSACFGRSLPRLNSSVSPQDIRLVLNVLLGPAPHWEILVAAQQTLSFPTKDGGRVMPMSMAKATMPLYLLTAADSTRRAGEIRPGLWCPLDSESWQSTSADPAARAVRARLISITPRLRTMCWPRSGI